MASKTIKSALDCDHECTAAMALMPDRSCTPDLTFCKQPEALMPNRSCTPELTFCKQPEVMAHDAELREFFADVKRFVLDGVRQIPVAERVHGAAVLAPVARHAAPVKDNE
jgi:hypothetical protein